MRTTLAMLALVGVTVSSLLAQAPPPAPAAPTAVKVLSSAQVQQATLIKAKAQELDREHAEAVKALEAAAAKLTQVKQAQTELAGRARGATPVFITALGGDPKTDTFDWTTLALGTKAAK